MKNQNNRNRGTDNDVDDDNDVGDVGDGDVFETFSNLLVDASALNFLMVPFSGNCSTLYPRFNVF